MRSIRVLLSLIIVVAILFASTLSVDAIGFEAETVYESVFVIYSGNSLELDEIVLNSFLMNVPGKFLCKEDCKGLCPQCGQDLNLGDCDCDNDTFDPRWAALKEIMEKTSDTE